MMSSQVLFGAINDGALLEDVLNNLKGDTEPEKFNKGEFVGYFLNILHETLTFTNEDVGKAPCEKSSTDIVNVNESPLQKPRSLNASITSPVSPLYQQNYVTPHNKKHLCLGDFIVADRKSSGKKRPQKTLFEENAQRTRRINPTSLNDHKLTSDNGNFRHNDNSFNFKEAQAETPPKALSERNILAKERHKIKGRFQKNVTVATATVSVLTKPTSDVKRTLVTHTEELDRLISIYAGVLRSFLVLNITSEVYFLISLLLLKGFKNTRRIDGVGDLERNRIDDLRDLFDSVHNVVYFSSKTLEEFFDLLSLFDKPTLRMLIDNEKLREFVPGLIGRLRIVYDNKSERVCDVYDSDVRLNVCFISDTDSRENFPSDTSFHAFRKQRDLFYEILRLWECNRLKPSWEFSAALGPKIRSLLNLHRDASNFVHLARLFKMQLIGTCGKSNGFEEGVSEDQSPLLSLPNVDTVKLKRLKSRLITKHFSNGINPTPTFTGPQEFYKDFISVASDHIFLRHLTDAFVSEIIDLNDSKFNLDEIEEESDGAVDVQTKKAYIVTLKRLRLLAKFLGYVESLPYSTECTNLTEKCLSGHTKVRSNSTLSINLKEILLCAIQRRSLIVTIPWITKYLSMLDYVTLRLPYCEEIFTILFGIYRNYTLKSTANVYLIKMSLGWLFELPHFPEVSFFGSADRRSAVTFVDSTKICLDELDLVDQNTLYSLCTYLEEVKKLLTSNSYAENVTVKHITPLRALQSPTELAKKKLEAQLEEAFFNGQPVSVRNTVEFVNERTASACVKHICNTIVPTFKKNSLTDFKRFLEDNFDTDDDSDTIKAKTFSYRIETLRKLEETCSVEAEKIMADRLDVTMTSLLALDVLKQTKDTCVLIATKMCKKRVGQWMNTHLTLSIFNKDFDSAVYAFANNKRKTDKKVIFMLPPNGRDVKHDENTLSAVHLIEEIRKYCVRLLEDKRQISNDDVAEVVRQAQATVTKRCDVNECILKVIDNLLVDFTLLLLAHTDLVDHDLTKKLCTVWKSHCGNTDDLFKQLVCPRNVMLLSQSDAAASWGRFSKFVAYLINEKYLSCDNFEGQCVGIFKREWDEVTLKSLTGCFKRVVDSTRKETTGELFPLLMTFLSDFCSDL